MIVRKPLPGTEAKIQVLMKRAEAHLPLHLMFDEPLPVEDARGKYRQPTVYARPVFQRDPPE